MKNIAAYTSFNYAYASKACVLAKTMKEFNPDWHVVAIVTDTYDINRNKLLEEFFDEIIFSDGLDIVDYDKFVKKYSVVEMCTAVKGAAACFLLARSYDQVFYFDPDIQVFSSLLSMSDALTQGNVLLTPHILTVESTQKSEAIIDTEVNALKYGIFNLGFIGFNNSREGRRVAKWWSDRLAFACIDAPGDGYFTDQKWCNHIPVLFDGVIIHKDFGCNLASWNLYERTVQISDEGDVFVNDDTLKFYHFTKFGSVGLAMTTRYAKDNFDVYELWANYGRELEKMDFINRTNI
ncbi:hypothetical protein PYE51_11650 [Vibrio aestuarianus]|uniref:Glycosyltransferase n=1 Tax=Vibrio aestuarianus TaxID=28171 RepID=A0AAX3U310_9VIBR|nr:hypothetical protein [Vibrio aestuarianus]WGK81279.1 hypothetical protein PYE51_11650 [Vibrio aestuarianus]